MSSNSATATPLIPLVATAAAGRKKKRRPNFRPRGKSVLPKAPPAEVKKDADHNDDDGGGGAHDDASAAIKENDSVKNENEQKVPLNSETNSPTAADSPSVPEKKTRRSLLSRKRKIITGVAVGFSRPKLAEEQAIEEAPPDSDQQEQQQLLQHERRSKPTPKAPAQIIPPDTSGAPKLSAYCARPRQSQRRKAKDDNNNATTANTTGRKNNRDQQHPPPPPPLPDTDQGNAAAAATGPVVQIVNGEIVLQESSLVVHGTAKAEEEFQVVEEEAQLAAIGASYNSFVNRKAPSHWTVQETALFYEALRQVGTDFGTMEAYFGSKRTRKQLKRKYQIEMSKNPHLVDKALDPSSKKEIDLSVFEMTQETVEQLAEEAAAKAAALALRAPPPLPEAEVVVEEDANADMQAATTTSPNKATPKQDAWWHMEEDEDHHLKQETFIEEEPIVKDPIFEEELEAEAQPMVALVLGVGGAEKKKKKPKFRSKKLKGK